MIVFDASSLVSAAFAPGSVPDRAVRHALRRDQIALSEAVMVELLDVLYRPRLARWMNSDQSADLLGPLGTLGVMLVPTASITDCRDPQDHKYLELALVAAADRIVSSDSDLLVLHPWRGIKIMRPAAYLAEA